MCPGLYRRIAPTFPILVNILPYSAEPEITSTLLPVFAAIKAKYKTGGNKDKKPIYSSDEDDSDVEKKKGKRLQKAKGMDSDSDSNR